MVRMTPVVASPPVLALFSGLDLEPAVFERGVAEARQRQVPLVLLNVRHQQQAERLAEALTSNSFMGRGAVEQLKRQIKDQRSELVRKTLETMAAEARSLGLDVVTRWEKGDLSAIVAAQIAELKPALVVTDCKYPGALPKDVQVICVAA